jgi:hypothetical protein
VIDGQAPAASGPESADLDADELNVESEGEEDAEGPVTASDVQRIVGEVLRPRERPSFDLAAGRPSEEDTKMVRYLMSWPPRDEAESAIAELSRLPPLALAMLTRFGTIELRQRQEGRRVGLRGPSPESTLALMAAGLVKAEGDNFAVLTEHGRELVRVLPIGKPVSVRPDWFEEVMSPLMCAG